MSSYTIGRHDSDSNLGLKVFALFAGITIPVVMLIGLWMAISADKARNDARRAVATAHKVTTTTSAGMSGMAMTPTMTHGAVASPSYAGVAPANADAIAIAHAAVPAQLPAAPAGAVAHVRLDLSHGTVAIAPGIEYEAWTFGGTAPGPAIHV